MSGQEKQGEFDERHARIEILLDVMGDYNNLATELTGEPPFYFAIEDCVDVLIKTLKGVKERLAEIRKEVAGAESSN